MIVGKGLIASQFLDCDREDVVFFASGVSNSSESRKEEFLREQKLIQETIQQNPEKIFVYFSTCSIYDSSKYKSLYVLHKLHMEEIIKEKAKSFLILRVSNVVGKGGNPNLLMNYLSTNIKNGSALIIHKNATRNLIDVADVRAITLNYIQKNNYNKIVNIAYTYNYYIEEIVNALEENYNFKTQKEIQDLGEHYTIDVHELDYNFPISNKIEYLNKLIKTYFEG